MSQTILRAKNSMQRGFAALAAIFLVVVLAALGAFMVTISNTEHLTSAQDIVGTRAYWAAKAGMEFGVGSVVGNGSCPVGAPNLLTIDGFSVCVSCSLGTYTDGSATPNVKIFWLSSEARRATLSSCTDLSPLNAAVGRPDYIERSVSAVIEQ